LFDLLQQDIKIYDTIGNVFIVGDWTSRVGNKRDYFECNRYVDFVDYADYIPDIPSVRNTVDTVCNSPGANMLDLCKATSTGIANGRLGHDTGSVTFISQAVSSVIDYLVLNEHDFYYINSLVIGRIIAYCHSVSKPVIRVLLQKHNVVVLKHNEINPWKMIFGVDWLVS